MNKHPTVITSMHFTKITLLKFSSAGFSVESLSKQSKTAFQSGRVQAEGDKLKTSKFGKLFELLITFEIVSQSQKSLVHSWVIVVRTGCHNQILLITPNLRLTAVFVTFGEGSFAIITFDLEP